MNILILSNRFGMGHWSASISLRQRLSAAMPCSTVTVEDLYAYALPGASEAVYRAFSLLVTHGVGFYNAYYKLTENAPPGTVRPYPHVLVDKLGDLLRARHIDVIIATHPICAQAVGDYKQKTDCRLPLITCITDLTAHSEWLCRGTDCYMVGAPRLREALISKGIPSERILVSGIPVRPEFTARAGRPGGPVRSLLMMGGGLGLLPRRGSFYAELDSMPDVRTTIITGGNRKLFERLVDKYPNINVVGYTDRVYDYMANADLMLSKPGGITLFEAISTGLPVLAWEPFLGQEVHNARFLLDAGIGRIAPKEPDGCLAAIRALVYDDVALMRMSSNMTELRAQFSSEGLDHLIARLTTMQGVYA